MTVPGGHKFVHSYWGTHIKLRSQRVTKGHKRSQNSRTFMRERTSNGGHKKSPTVTQGHKIRALLCGNAHKWLSQTVANGHKLRNLFNDRGARARKTLELGYLPGRARHLRAQHHWHAPPRPPDGPLTYHTYHSGVPGTASSGPAFR